ncbi:type IV pilus assembly protein PilO [Ruminiclostridium sufflavum DSM 19573]|uniref:Type IV pilus assembly protein PilO n=1 Tax=Ruminiclostridium sufflavum DSM 19573 TaxID=1121337 RepID=A0A318XI95_9FIRM|nr:hypothetical protein [Ruminiclostridium sufflavum]PYG85641.1 type IV pilus assembly protein PilO [Ruminiclostridium sufflavum DSM 19573]
MKLTAHDKKLLIGLAIFIFAVVFVKFLMLPKLSDINTLREELAALDNNYSVNMAYKPKAENIDSDLKILSEKLADLRAVYPPKIDISELIMVVKKLGVDSKLEFTSVGFEEYKAADSDENAGSLAEQAGEAEGTGDTSNAGASAAEAVNQAEAQKEANNAASAKIDNYFYLWGLKSQSNNNNDKIDIPDGAPYSVSVKIEAEGTNEQIKAFFENINKLETKTYCKSSSISGSSTGKSEDTEGKLKLSAVIAFYGIMDSGAGGYYLLPNGRWTPTAPADNKTNLFKEYGGFDSTGLNNATSTVKANDNESTELGNYDFAVVASAFGGGLAPSVSIGCKNPADNTGYSRPVAYGDSKGIENAEIFIEEKAGRYYCKFKTDHEAYPDKGYSQTFEFIPQEKSLRLVVLSSRRNGNEDKAGVNISIINNTSRTLNYLIKYDDEKSPRVKIGKTTGSVRNEK